jgi:hypothetical protein
VIGDQQPEPIGLFVARFVRDTLTRYVVLPPEHVIACTLWVLHTWAFDACYTTPYLAVLSAEKQSGKTLLLDVLQLLVREPMQVSGASEAALFRSIEKRCPTLLLDESDAIFASNAERTEPIRGLLNSGSRRTGQIARAVPPDWDVKPFSTFCPKALAGIDNGRWPDTILDRSIVLRMRRRAPHQRGTPFRYKRASEAAQTVRTACEAWATEAIEELEVCEPDLPASLSDRASDAWEPLIAIADSLSETWGIEARWAARVLHERESDRSESAGTCLLRDIKAVFNEIGADRVPSGELASRLRAMPEAPWSEYGHSRAGLTQPSLARLLRPYEISSRTIRVASHHAAGATARGYHASDFAKAWETYLVTDQTSDDESV